ncbi:MAG: hypothetical protein IKM38_08255 [Christensenellaceae bacterium]|nr:hypothetical protein [Christensenellaceae bacterium]
MKKFTVMPQLETPIGSIFLSLNGKSIPFMRCAISRKPNGTCFLSTG